MHFHISALFIVIFLLIIGPELLHHAFEAIVETVLWCVAALAAIAVFMVGCRVVVFCWHLVVPRYIDSATAHAAMDPVLGFLTIVAVALFFVDSVTGFGWTSAGFRRIIAFKGTLHGTS